VVPSDVAPDVSVSKGVLHVNGVDPGVGGVRYTFKAPVPSRAIAYTLPLNRRTLPKPCQVTLAGMPLLPVHVAPQSAD
jgi:hypothetical protein